MERTPAGEREILEAVEASRRRTEVLSRSQTNIHVLESVLNSVINKLKLVFCLPILLADEDEQLALLMDKKHLSLLKELLEYQTTPDKPRKMGEDISDKDISFYTYEPNTAEYVFNAYQPNINVAPKEEDIKFHSLLEDIFSIPEVEQLCRNLESEISLEASGVIRVIKQIRDVTVPRMQVGPDEEMEREKQLCDMYIMTQRLGDELLEMNYKLSQTMEKHTRQLQASMDEINQIQCKSERIIQHAKDLGQFFGRTADNKMMWERKKSEYIQDTLSSELKTLESTLATSLSLHLIKEKSLRVKRFKTEAQLLTVLKKYDVDVKERDLTFKELTELLEEEVEQLAQLQKTFDEQSVEYHALMDEKEEYERKIWEERLYSVQTRLAARRIQRYYRAYVALCKAHNFNRFKKKKKGKKKGPPKPPSINLLDLM